MVAAVVAVSGDKPLSQDDIDALLAAAAGGAQPSASPAQVSPGGGKAARGAARAAEGPERPVAASLPSDRRRTEVGALPRQPGTVRSRLEAALADLEVEVVAVLGEAELTVREVLALGPGSVVELERGVELPVEVRLRGRTVARGEVVLDDGCYAIRITENLLRGGPEA